MKIVHAVGFYFPDSMGGSEVYVQNLAKALIGLNYQVVVCAPHEKTNTDSYLFEGIKVFRYPALAPFSQNQLQGKSAHHGFEYFQQWLKDQQADIYHQHSWTTGCGLPHLRYAKSLGLKTAITVHVPVNVCIRGTMVKFGLHTCDGKILVNRCSQCWAQSKNMPFYHFLGWIPLQMSRQIEQLSIPSKALTALSMPSLVDNHLKNLLEMAKCADKVIAVCQWLYDALLLNGVPKEKLALSRQGVTQVATPLKQPTIKSNALTIGYLGRLDSVKGIDILIKAFKKLSKNYAVTLNIAGNASKKNYEQYLKRLAEADARIQFLGTIDQCHLADFFGSIDLLAVPSQWLETGPLVVLESHSYQKPVIGSALGGIKELVKEGITGFLVQDFHNVEAWFNKLLWIYHHQEKVTPVNYAVKTMKDVAKETSQFYKEIYQGIALP